MTTSPPLAPTPATILHLSDLHFGEGEVDDTDWKMRIDFAERSTRAAQLMSWLRRAPKVPDYVVISGDVTIRGNSTGFDTLKEHCRVLDEAGMFPPLHKVILVPGNHDVIRLNQPQRGAREADRWRHFAALGSDFVRPWIPALDPEENELFKRFRETASTEPAVIGGIQWRLRRGTQVFERFPVLFDRNDKMVFYAFNSASISGTRITVSNEELRDIDFLRQNEMANRDKVQNLLGALDRLLQIDPARIQPSELELFQRIVPFLADRFGREWDEAFKVAVLHHNVFPLHHEEVKEFSLILNAGAFKMELANAGFHLVLHGHEHDPGTYIDTAIPRAKRPLTVVSSATVGGNAAPNRTHGFQWIEISPDRHSFSVRLIEWPDSGGGYDRAWNEAPTTPFVASPTRTPGVARRGYGRRVDLRGLHAQTADALLAVQRSEPSPSGGEWIGWCHRVEEDEVSTIATAYGLIIMRDLGVEFEAFRGEQVIRSLLEMRLPDKGWSASMQGEHARPEATALALLALSAWGRTAPVKEGLAAYEKLFAARRDPTLWRHVTSLATAIKMLTAIHSTSPMLETMVDKLWNARNVFERDTLFFWSHRLDAQRPTSEPSVAHTALAVSALARAPSFDASALTPAVEWLLSAPKWENTNETLIRRKANTKPEKLYWRHFTRALVINALLETDVDPAQPRLAEAVDALLEERREALWWWPGTTERPIWMTCDAVHALNAYAFATCTV